MAHPHGKTAQASADAKLGKLLGKGAAAPHGKKSGGRVGHASKAGKGWGDGTAFSSAHREGFKAEGTPSAKRLDKRARGGRIKSSKGAVNIVIVAGGNKHPDLQGSAPDVGGAPGGPPPPGGPPHPQMPPPGGLPAGLMPGVGMPGAMPGGAPPMPPPKPPGT